VTASKQPEARVYTAIVGPRDGEWFPIEVPEVPGVFTQARNPAEVEEIARDAVALMLDVPLDEVAIRAEWSEPFFSATHKPIRGETYEEAKEAVWREQHEKYRAMREER
jgi:predicted RNase H-like HicB family nuclease